MFVMNCVFFTCLFEVLIVYHCAVTVCSVSSVMAAILTLVEMNLGSIFFPVLFGIFAFVGGM